MNAHVGLCAGCRHARIIENRRGSRFWLCGRSHTDPRFPRYPPLPVLHCIGYEPATEPPVPPTESGTAGNNGL